MGCRKKRRCEWTAIEFDSSIVNFCRSFFLSLFFFLVERNSWIFQLHAFYSWVPYRLWNVNVTTFVYWAAPPKCSACVICYLCSKLHCQWMERETKNRRIYWIPRIYVLWWIRVPLWLCGAFVTFHSCSFYSVRWCERVLLRRIRVK